jgi:prevent-host-death family protein
MFLDNIRESIRPVSDFRKDLPQFLKKMKEDHHPIILTQRGRSVAVLVDIESYERMEYQGRLRASIARGLKDAEEGRVTPHEKVMKDIRESIGRKSASR